MAEPISEIISKLSEVGFVRYDGPFGSGEWSDVHRLFVTVEPIEDLTELKTQPKWCIYAWMEGDNSVDIDEVKAAFDLAGAYTCGERVGSGPYGGYDLLKRPE